MLRHTVIASGSSEDIASVLLFFVEKNIIFANLKTMGRDQLLTLAGDLVL